MRLPFFSKPEAVLRPARPSDASALAEIHAEGGFAGSWSPSEFESLLADRAVITDIASDSRKTDALFGFVMSRMAADEAEILTIAVRRKSRGNHIGQRLMDAHMARLAGFGIKTLYLEVEEDNHAALRLYDKTGFVTAGLRKGYYRKPDGGFANALIMKLGLENL